MSTATIFKTVTANSAATEHLAEQVGRKLTGSEVIELSSDLGGGKTTFVKGLAKGIGSKAHVSSPTFKVCNVYKGQDLTLLHYDFYRIHDDKLIAHEFQESLNDSKTVIVTEWGNLAGDVINKPKLAISIVNNGGTKRSFSFLIPNTYQHLLEGLR